MGGAEMHATLSEIRKAPEGIIKAQEAFESVKDEISLPRRITYTGCGSSNFLSQLLAMATNALGGEGFSLPSSEFLNARNYYFLNHELIVAISRSGETTEVLKVLDVANSKTLGITAYESSLSRNADYSLVVHTPEESVVMTHSFQAFYFAYLQLLRNSYGFDPYDHSDVVELSKEALANEDYVKWMVEDFDFKRVFFLGSGILYPVALEGMLKMKEMALFWSEACQTFEVRHGFKSVIDSETLVVLMVDYEHEWHEKLIKELQGQGAKVLLIGKESLGAKYFIEMPRSDSLLKPIFVLPVVQLLSYYKAVKRGLNPDNPRFLEKVVRW